MVNVRISDKSIGLPNSPTAREENGMKNNKKISNVNLKSKTTKK